MSNSLDEGAQFAGSDTSRPPGPFSASSRGTFGRLQAPRHGVANTNAALKSDADRNRGGGEKNEKSRQKTSSRRKSKIKNQIDVVEDKRLLNLTRFAWRGFGRVGPPQKRRLLKSRNFDPATFANRQKSDSTQKERFSGPGLQPPPLDHSRLLVEGHSAESGLLDKFKT